VDKSKIISGDTIQPGDVILGLPSSGLHSNGFSLVRKIVFDRMGYSVDTHIEELGSTIGEELIRPTRIYSEQVLPLLEKYEVKGLSHITGGGFFENIPRMLPDGTRARVYPNVIRTPKIFKLLQKWGKITEEEMYGTFNMGVGMVIAAAPDEAEKIAHHLVEEGENFYVFGEVIEGEKGVDLWTE
jgi:phosphoribosylformylglycinamidine cyclo-ligase